MNLGDAIALRSTGRAIQAGAPKQDSRYQPVHAGAHNHFVKIGYMHTGNKHRGGVITSNYFKRSHNGNSRNVAVRQDGSFLKTSQTEKGQRRMHGRMNADGSDNISRETLSPDAGKRYDAAAGNDQAKPDHLAEYGRLMKESAAHQRAADALAQSHQEEDRPLYEHHAGKAWRTGNKAMEHFKRLTKEQRAMLKEQHWQNSQPQPTGAGKKKAFNAAAQPHPYVGSKLKNGEGTGPCKECGKGYKDPAHWRLG